MRPFHKKYRAFFTVLISVFMLIVLGEIVYVIKPDIYAPLSKMFPKQSPSTTSSVTPTPTKSIVTIITPESSIGKPYLKVGEETLYVSDFIINKNSVALGANLPISDEELKKHIDTWLIRYSVLLQEGERDDYITLENTYYNAISKDANLRAEKIRELEDAYKDEEKHSSGEVVAVWFMNVDPGPVGYEKGKEIAEEKITVLHNQATSGDITLKEAGEAIINDSSISQIDPSYKINAYFKFTIKPDERITFSDGFNEVINNLAVGEISEVYLAKDYAQDRSLVDAVYLFGTVTERKEQGIDSYEDWLTEKVNEYEVTYY